jgi:Tfp pilus assembly protein PilV
MSINKLLKNQNGIGLVEVLAAFSISIVVITALVSMALYTLRSSLNSKLLLEGTKIATRETERVRALRDTSATWVNFMTAVNTCKTVSNKCHISPPSTVAQGTNTETIDGQAVIYSFYVVPDTNDPNNIVRILVDVTWTVGGVPKGTHIYTDLTNWQPK